MVHGREQDAIERARRYERMREEVEEVSITEATVGDDRISRHVLATAVERFPDDPEPDEEPRPAKAGRMAIRPEDEDGDGFDGFSSPSRRGLADSPAGQAPHCGRREPGGSTRTNGGTVTGF